METIEIKKGIVVDYEDMLRGAAQMNTQDLENYVHNIHRMLSARKGSSNEETAIDLERAIKEIIPASVRRREKTLYNKLQNESITDKEREELTFLIQWMEEKSAERIELMARLAAIRNISLPELARQLRINAS